MTEEQPEPQVVDMADVLEALQDCPWPAEVWTMTTDDYVKLVPDERTRTAVSGFLMRKGWECASATLQRIFN